MSTLLQRLIKNTQKLEDCDSQLRLLDMRDETGKTAIQIAVGYEKKTS